MFVLNVVENAATLCYILLYFLPVHGNQGVTQDQIYANASATYYNIYEQQPQLHFEVQEKRNKPVAVYYIPTRTDRTEVSKCMNLNPEYTRFRRKKHLNFRLYKHNFNAYTGVTQDQISTSANTLLDNVDDSQKQLDNEVREKLNRPKVWVIHIPTRFPLMSTDLKDVSKAMNSKVDYTRHRRSNKKKISKYDLLHRYWNLEQKHSTNSNLNLASSRDNVADLQTTTTDIDYYIYDLLSDDKHRNLSSNKTPIEQPVMDEPTDVPTIEETPIEEPLYTEPLYTEPPLATPPAVPSKEESLIKAQHSKKIYNKKKIITKPPMSKKVNALESNPTVGIPIEERKEEPCPKPKCPKWNYVEQDNWKASYPSCGGLSQSPINVYVKTLVHTNGSRRLHFANYNNRPTNITVINNKNIVGFTGSWKRDDRPCVFGGAAHSRRYLFHSLTMYMPSGHCIEGYPYPMESQILHISAQYDSIEQAIAAAPKDPLAFLGIVNIYKYDKRTDKGLSVLIDAVTKCPPGAVLKLDEPLSFYSPPFKDYACYQGSLTTPPCTEAVLWLIRSETLTVTREDLDKARTAIMSQRSLPIFTRMPQMTHDRKVYLFH